MSDLHLFITPDNLDAYQEEILQRFWENEDARNNERNKRYHDVPPLALSASGEPYDAIKNKQAYLVRAFEVARSCYNGVRVCATVRGKESYIPYVCYRTQVALTVAAAAGGTCEEIVAALLLPLYDKLTLASITHSKLSNSRFTDIMGSKETMSHIFKALNAYQQSKENKSIITEEEIDRLIFRLCSDRMFERILAGFDKKSHDAAVIQRAYRKAQAFHGNTAALLLPLGTARILASYRMEGEIIAAALLQGVPLAADSLDEPANRLTPAVYGYTSAVDTVTETVTKARDSSDANATTPESLCGALERAVTERSKRFAALCIKAASCICQLRMSESGDMATRKEAAENVRKNYLPLFRSYHLNGFCATIEAECLRCKSPANYAHLARQYRSMLTFGEYDVKQCRLALDEYICSFNTDLSFKKWFKGIRAYPFELESRPYTVAELDQLTGSGSDVTVTLTKKNTVIQKFFIILRADKNAHKILPFFRLFVMNYAEKNGLACHERIRYTIHSVDYDPTYNQHIIRMVDSYCNRFDVIITSEKDHRFYLYGNKNFQRSSEEERLDENTITVYSSKMRPYRLPVGATALDFAYQIHDDLGLCAYDAIIDQMPHKPLDTVLTHGQVVHICRWPDGEPEGQAPVVRAELNQLLFVVTPKAKRALVREFKQRLAKASADTEFPEGFDSGSKNM